MESSLGKMAALAALFQRHRDQLIAMVRRRMDRSLFARVGPEDILSNAFLVARTKFDSFSKLPGDGGYVWLYGIVLETLYETWRKENQTQRDVKKTISWPPESASYFGRVLADGGTSPSAAADRQLYAQMVRDVLSRLPVQAQEILSMRHFDQLNHREVGQILGISHSSAAQRYTRALRKLRQNWKETYGDIK